MTGSDSLKLRAIIFSALGALLLCPVMPGDAKAEQLDKEQAESRLADVNRAISELKEQLEGSRADQRKEQAQLRQFDLAIQDAALDYRQLEQQRSLHLQELAGLEHQRQDYLTSLGERLDQLAEQVNAAYRTARANPVEAGIKSGRSGKTWTNAGLL